MGEKIVNLVLSAIVGGISAIGAIWFLYEPETKTPSESSATTPVPSSFEELEVGRLKVTDGIMVYHSETGEPLIELKDGVVLAKKEILGNFIGGMEMVGQKLQITTGDPSAPNPPVFGEIATGEDGGVYLALLSAKGNHSVNIGFDKNETGFIISQNNGDQSRSAQAILPIPSKEGDGNAVEKGTSAGTSEKTESGVDSTPVATASNPTEPTPVR